MSTKFQVRTWLWVVLAIVVAGALGYGGWYYNYKVVPSKLTVSPSPTLSAAVTSPSPGATATPTSGKTSTPSGGGQTATPSGGQTSTATPTPQTTPPAGWKLEKNYLSSGGGAVYGGYYQLFIKDNWTAREDSAFVTWPHRQIFYGDGPKCGSSPADQTYQTEDCIFKIGGKDFTIEFYPGKISDSDKKIVLDSFQLL